MDDSTIIHPRLPGRDRNLALNLLFVFGFTFEVEEIESIYLILKDCEGFVEDIPSEFDKALVRIAKPQGKIDQYCLLLTNRGESKKFAIIICADRGWFKPFKKGRNPRHSLLLFDQE